MGGMVFYYLILSSQSYLAGEHKFMKCIDSSDEVIGLNL